MFTPNLCRPGVAGSPARCGRRQLRLQIQDFAIVGRSVRKSVAAASMWALVRGNIKAVADNVLSAMMNHKARRYERRALLRRKEHHAVSVELHLICAFLYFGLCAVHVVAWACN
jgi:hypothetical protein